MYDVGLILAHEVGKDRTLSRETRERVEKGVRICRAELTRSLIMSGGYVNGNDFSIAECMAEYAMKMRLNRDEIILEDVSLDTVGQFVFTKEGVLVPRGYKSILVITHDYHLPRAKVIGHTLMKGYDMGFITIPSKENKEIEERERKSLGLFMKSFVDNPVNGESLVEALVKRQPLYKDSAFFKAELERLRK